MTEETMQSVEYELAQCRRVIAELQGDRENRQGRQQYGQKIEAVLAAMIEATDDYILALDLNNRLIFANGAFSRLFSQLYNHELRPDDDVMGFMTRERKQFWHDILETTRTTGISRFDWQYYLADTRYDIEWTNARVLGKDGQAVGVVQIGRDITARRLAEETLRERDAQLLSAQRLEAVGALAGGVAHEFNNALSIVLGNLELCSAEIRTGHSARPYIDDAREGILRAKKVVRQLLDFSRKSDGKRLYVEVQTIATRALGLLRASIPAHVEFHQHIETCPPVVADPSHIHQLIINLCTNAADAMDEDGGVMTVTLEHITLKTGKVPGNLPLAPGQYAKLTVADTGCGMDGETFNRLYEPFFTTKGPDRGSGMGLVASQDLVHSYGGCIVSHTKPGRGSKFEVYLPTVAPQTQGEDALAHDPAAMMGNERILLVDDEPRFVFLTQRQLASMGYKVEMFTSSIHALERFKAAPDDFDLVITDVAMPKITGENLVKQLRLLRPTLPVILCTGYSQKMDQQTAAILGCEYLVKPFEIEQLAYLIRKTLDKRSPVAR